MKTQDIDLEYFCDLDLDSDYEPEEQDIEMLTEDKDEEEQVPVKKRRRSQLNEGSPDNHRKVINMKIYLSYFKSN